MVNQIHQPELQLDKANLSDSVSGFTFLNISDDLVSSKTDDKHDDFDFDIVNFPRCNI